MENTILLQAGYTSTVSFLMFDVSPKTFHAVDVTTIVLIC